MGGVGEKRYMEATDAPIVVELGQQIAQLSIDRAKWRAEAFRANFALGRIQRDLEEANERLDELQSAIEAEYEDAGLDTPFRPDLSVVAQPEGGE